MTSPLYRPGAERPRLTRRTGVVVVLALPLPRNAAARPSPPAWRSVCSKAAVAARLVDLDRCRSAHFLADSGLLVVSGRGGAIYGTV
jgi:hypothetical protein